MNNELKNFYRAQSEQEELAKLSDSAKLRVKNEIFSKLGQQLVPEPVSKSSRVFAKVNKIMFRGYVIAPLIVVLFVTGTTIVSADALPGETLYSVKRQVENARLFIAPTESSKLELQVNFAKKRLDEAERIHASSKKNNIELQVQNENDDSFDEEKKSEDKNEPEKIRKRQDDAQREANRAFEFLDEAKKDLEQRGKQERVKDIEDRLKRFREDAEDQEDHEQNRVRSEDRDESSDEDEDVD